MPYLPLTLISLLLTAMLAVSARMLASSLAITSDADETPRGITRRILATFGSNRELYLTALLAAGTITLVLYTLGIWFSLHAPLLHLCRSNPLAILLLVIAAVLLLWLAVALLSALAGSFAMRSVMRWVAPFTWLFYAILYPLARLLVALAGAWMHLTHVSAKPRTNGFTLSKVELDAFLQDNLEKGSEPTEVENEMKMLHNALDFGNVYVRDCMVPRTEIIAVDIEKDTDDDLLHLLVDTGKSKVIVYRNNIDNIIGYYHVAEMFHGGDWRTKVRSLLFVPETKPANKLMRLFMQQKKSIAVVVDEFGGTAGIVTLEDLVEEIFGEIEDEHDRTNLVARRDARGEYDFSGRMEISKINEDFGIGIPESDDYLTLAGYILNHYQTIPAQGETVTIGRFAFTITRRRANRIELVHLKIASD